MQIAIVCKSCEKRSKGPKKFGAKKVARVLSQALRQARQPRTRIVQTGCMGLCPKKAVAVAAAASGGALNVIAWHKADDPVQALQTLFEPSTGAAGNPSPSSSISSPEPT